MVLGVKGGSRLTALIYIFISIFVIYAAIKTIPPYMDFYSMDDEVAQQLHLSTINSDDVILNDLAKKAADLELPITKDQIILKRNDDGSLTIEMSWARTVDYGYGFKRDFPFEINSNSKKVKD